MFASAALDVSASALATPSVADTIGAKARYALLRRSAGAESVAR